MIVQCEQCNTRFKLDDSKVREEGVKVRCSKCRHIFIVTKERPEQGEEADFDTLLSGLIAAPQGSIDATAKEDAAPQGESPVLPEFNETTIAAPPPEAEFGSGDSRDDFPFSSVGFEPEQQPAIDESASQQEVSPFDTLQSNAGVSSDFSFGESSDDAEVNKFQGIEDEFSQPSPFEETLKSSPQIGEHESAEFTFGDVSIEESVEADTPKGIPADGSLTIENISPKGIDSNDRADDSFAAISWDFAAPVSGSSAAESLDTPVEETSLESKIAKSIPPDEIPVPETHKNTFPELIAADDELPPLAIASRKRGSSLIPVVVTAISVLVIIALAGVGLFVLNKGPTGLDKAGLGALVRWVGLDKGEEGSIVIRNATSGFLKNKEIGEIFVIRGEAVNAFRRPRASIQVKATLYGAKGTVVGNRTVYCGNPLTKEQLTTLPLVKIEAAMGNQFGDSLVNLGVQPGKAIPFVIVLTNVPTDASEFGLEIVGSTVASQ